MNHTISYTPLRTPNQLSCKGWAFRWGCYDCFGLVPITQLTMSWSDYSGITETEFTNVGFVVKNRSRIFSHIVDSLAICESEFSFNILTKTSYSLGKLHPSLIIGTSSSSQISLG